MTPIISFCTSCRGRLWQLKETLPENLATYINDPNIHFVLVDYNDEEVLEWIKNSRIVCTAISAGQLTYVRELTASHFHAARAKNLAHRFARGNIVCNLDADNWVKGLAEAAMAVVTARSLLHAWNNSNDGTYGRIALSARWFEYLGGYDESFHPMAYQDTDLLRRSALLGLRSRRIGGWPKPIRNTLTQKVKETGSALSWRAMHSMNRSHSKRNIALGHLVANCDGRAAAKVSVDFGPAQVLGPLLPRVSIK